MPARFNRRFWKWLTAGLVLLAAPAVGLKCCDHWVRSAAAGRVFDDLAELPAAPVGLVLGCSPQVAGGRANLFFQHRVSAAAELYKAGKIRALIVSGDNSTKEYDEPTAMKAALVQAGVPEERIYCDYAGFRTLDSTVRVRQLFGQDRVIIISQKFHNERAVFLAREHGVDATAFNARDVPGIHALRANLREALARVQAVLDVKLLGTKPKFLGPPVEVRLD